MKKKVIKLWKRLGTQNEQLNRKTRGSNRSDDEKKEMDDKGQFQPNKREQLTQRNGAEYEVN